MDTGEKKPLLNKLREVRAEKLETLLKNILYIKIVRVLQRIPIECPCFSYQLPSPVEPETVIADNFVLQKCSVIAIEKFAPI